MRMLYGLLLTFCSFRVVSAQANSDKVASSIDVSRTIIAKLDHAAQDDPPPNFASSIVVRVHQEARNYITLADSVSTTVHHGGAPGGASMFTLYSQFIDLLEQYELFTSVETRPLELDKVRSEAMSKESFEIKTFFEVVTTSEILRLEEELRSCRAPKPH